MNTRGKHHGWVGLVALALAAAAWACGPLSGVTEGLEEAQTGLEEAATTAAQLATDLPEAVEESGAVQPADDVSGDPAALAPGPGVGQTPAGASGAEVTQWAIYAQASTEYGSEDWSALQITGENNTFECGDIRTAYATANSTGKDWIRVGYASAVIPTRVNVYQTYNPGAIVRLDVVDANGGLHTVYEGVSPTLDCPVTVPYDIVGVDYPVAEIVIYLDQTITGSWNELDAVQLIGTAP